jgi:catechol 2,3-dioxygenase
MSRFRLPDAAHIARVHLRVSSLSEALAFYLDILGFRLIEREGDTAALSATGAGPAQILVTGLPGARRKPRGTTGLYHVAIRLPGESALGRLLRRLGDQDWPLLGLSDHLVSEAIYLADPDGNGLEFYCDRPREQWAHRAGQVQMATEPLDADALLQAAGDGPWTGIDPGTDVGHVHLHVSDLQRAEAFYHNLIGLDVTQRSYSGALFLSAGGYHHHVGVNVWAGFGAPSPPADAVGLLSFGLHVPDVGAWEDLVRRLTSAGVAVEEWRRDDTWVGALVRDPDRIGVELLVDRTDSALATLRKLRGELATA